MIQTKTDIASNINPIDCNLQIEKVRTWKHGGILVGCSSSKDNSRFRKLAQENLSATYNIKEVKGISPRVKFVGITQNYEESDLSDIFEHAIKFNSNIFNLSSECKVLKFWATKKNPKIDRNSYDRLMTAGGLFVGYDYCSVLML